MQGVIKAVIFDMDGVLIDSEPLWRKAMIQGFTSCGFEFTEADCRATTGMRLREVIAFWLTKWERYDLEVATINTLILDRLTQLVEMEGQEMPGASDLLAWLKRAGYKIGLATSSDERFMNMVLNHLNLRAYFDVVVSAQRLQYAKPHPEVFLNCAAGLGVLPDVCLVIEDSVNGVIAAKAASMQVAAIPEVEFRDKVGFKIADWQLVHLEEVKWLLSAH